MPDHASQPPFKLAEPLRLDEIQVCTLPYAAGEGRGLLKRVLAGYVGCEVAQIMLVEGPHGRPELASGLADGLRFNWSHSGPTVVVAVSLRVQPGIDVEQRGRRSPHRMVAIARRFFSPREATWLATLPSDAQEQAFLRLWTAKEAVLKAHGHGLSFGLHRLELELRASGATLRSIDGDTTDAWQVHPLSGDDAHVATLAWRGPVLAVRKAILIA